MEVDYSAYLNLDSIKSRIKEAAKKILEEGIQDLKEKMLEALGLPKVYYMIYSRIFDHLLLSGHSTGFKRFISDQWSWMLKEVNLCLVICTR